MLKANGTVSVAWCGEAFLVLARSVSRRPPPLSAYDGQDLSDISARLDMDARGFSDPGFFPPVRVYLHTVRNGYLVIGDGADGVMLTADRKIIDGVNAFAAPHLRVADAVFDLPHSGTLDEVFVGFDAAWRNYYHWTCFALGKMALASQLLSRDLCFVVPEPSGRVVHRIATDTFRESLSLLGVASRTAFLEPGIYSVRSLRFFWTVPQEPTAMMYLPEVHEFFAKSVPTLPDAAAARRVLILRDPAHDPRLTGDEVELIRRVAYDFEPITFDFMTAKEQTSVMRSASHVIGAHGAGLANLLYAAPGCRILEITMNLAGESVLRPWFYQIAARRGLPYLHLNKGTGDLTPSRVAEAMLALRRAR